MKIDKYITNYIDGAFVPPISGKYIENYNPSTGEVYSFLPDSGDGEVKLAIAAAEKAFPKWSKAGVRRRFRLLTRMADIIEQNLEDFARAETTDTGMPISLSKTIAIPRSHTNFRYFALAAAQNGSEMHHMERQAINFTLRQPIGVVGCISGWSMPLYLMTWKVAAALAVGNCVVAKPSELTPMTAYLLSKAAAEAGLPSGVLNIVHGHGDIVGKTIVEHPKVKAISFTGNTKTGQQIAEIASPMFKKVSLDLGAKNPSIVFADCDFDEMMRNMLSACFSHQGQIRQCTSRIFVERPIYERFKKEFVKRAEFLSVGDPFLVTTSAAAVISDLHQEKILSYMALAELEGGTILCGGGVAVVDKKLNKGYFVRPTIIEGLPNNSKVNQNETTGPIVTIMPFDTDAEAIGYANDNQYGFSATVWTTDISRANQVAELLEAGLVWVNCWLVRDLRTPYSGTKNSGSGVEGGVESLRFFTETKNVCVKYY